jgi:hypothetical protein
MRRWFPCMFVVIAAAAAAATACAQTVALPPPASSSLDRIAQALPPGTSLPPPPPTWDPYAPQAFQPLPPPGSPPPSVWAPSAISGQPGYPGYTTAAPSLVPTQGTAGPSSLFPATPPGQPSAFQQTYAQTMHVYQGARGSWAYLLGDGQGSSLGVNELDTTATFALPFFYNSQANLNRAPLLITPGFGLQLWDGPETTASNFVDLPPNTYDVFLDTAWNPQFTPLFGAELGIRFGIYTNWNVLTSESWRIMGRAIGTLQLTPTMQGKAGIVYLDRNLVKILPAVGLTWTPDADSRYDIFFPAPRAARRLWNSGKHSWWGYLSGEYGGGAWTYRSSLPGDFDDTITPFDYNDIRIALGAEFVPNATLGMAGNVEIGYVFYRQLYFPYAPQRYADLQDTIMFRVGLAY